MLARDYLAFRAADIPEALAKVVEDVTNTLGGTLERLR